jgi:hypothetical protein
MKAPRKAPYNHKNKTKNILKIITHIHLKFFLKKAFLSYPAFRD